MKRILTGTLALLLAGASGIPAAAQNTAQSNAQGDTKLSERSTERLVREVRSALRKLPYTGVFDHLAYQVQHDGTVVLQGAVVRPVTRSDAEHRVKRIEGVEKVVNNITVLPPSMADDRIRLSAYNRLFGNDSHLSRYSWEPNPDIRILVNRGHITLEGVVTSEADRNFASIRAREVPGAFSVTNNLRVERSS